jgi:RNA polymerase sigma-70 factor (family 1)
MQATSKIAQLGSENEEYLMVAFREGDQEAFRKIYDRMCKPLYFFVQNIINSPSDTEDLVATAFVKLYDGRAGMESYEHIRRWLYVIIRNQAIDFLRARRRAREAIKQVIYLEEENDETLNLEMLKTTLLQSLSEEIDSLPRQRRTILRLYFFEQKTTAEIAELLKLSTQTVLNHKTRALESLRNTFLKPEWFASGVLFLILEVCLFLMNP